MEYQLSKIEESINEYMMDHDQWHYSCKEVEEDSEGEDILH